jgi:inhibitor of cysteine peptidase
MSEIVVSESDRGRTISASLGDTIEVELPESPTTGFRWTIAPFDTHVLELKSNEFLPNAGAGVGGGGRRFVRLSAKGRGSTTLEFMLARPWETGAPRSVFTVTLSIG